MGKKGYIGLYHTQSSLNRKSQMPGQIKIAKYLETKIKHG